MCEGFILHFDIKETRKNRATSNVGLGTPLTIEIVNGVYEVYEDLDEVMARHVEPMLSFAKQITRHRKFMSGSSLKEIDDAVHQQWVRNQTVRPYALCLSYETVNRPYFCISYIRSASGNVHHEYITVTPDGYRYRKISFPTVERLIAYFKVNCAKQAPGIDYQEWN